MKWSGYATLPKEKIDLGKSTFVTECMCNNYIFKNFREILNIPLAFKAKVTDRDPHNFSDFATFLMEMDPVRPITVDGLDGFYCPNLLRLYTNTTSVGTKCDPVVLHW